MSDLISRSALIMRLNDYALQVAPFRDMKSTWQYDAVQECIKAVEEQLTVEPAADVPDIYVGNKWIPVSERSPEVNGVYCITRKINDGERIYYIPDSAYWDGISTWHDDTRVNHSRPYLTNVIAWMPLSEPYKEEV